MNRIINTPSSGGENKPIVGRSLIASTNNLQYGDVYVGFKGRDEDYVAKGKYKMEGDTVEDLDYFIPPRCVTTRYAEDDVKEFDDKFRWGR